MKWWNETSGRGGCKSEEGGGETQKVKAGDNAAGKKLSEVMQNSQRKCPMRIVRCCQVPSRQKVKEDKAEVTTQHNQ